MGLLGLSRCIYADDEHRLWMPWSMPFDHLQGKVPVMEQDLRQGTLSCCWLAVEVGFLRIGAYVQYSVYEHIYEHICIFFWFFLNMNLTRFVVSRLWCVFIFCFLSFAMFCLGSPAWVSLRFCRTIGLMCRPEASFQDVPNGFPPHRG